MKKEKYYKRKKKMVYCLRAKEKTKWKKRVRSLLGRSLGPIASRVIKFWTANSTSVLAVECANRIRNEQNTMIIRVGQTFISSLHTPSSPFSYISLFLYSRIIQPLSNFHVRFVFLFIYELGVGEIFLLYAIIIIYLIWFTVPSQLMLAPLCEWSDRKCVFICCTFFQAFQDLYAKSNFHIIIQFQMSNM